MAVLKDISKTQVKLLNNYEILKFETLNLWDIPGLNLKVNEEINIQKPYLYLKWIRRFVKTGQTSQVILMANNKVLPCLVWQSIPNVDDGGGSNKLKQREKPKNKCDREEKRKQEKQGQICFMAC